MWLSRRLGCAERLSIDQTLSGVIGSGRGNESRAAEWRLQFKLFNLQFNFFNGLHWSKRSFNIPLERRTPLLQQLKQADVRAVFAGHYHRNAYGRAGAMEMITTGPVGRPLGKDPSGFRIVIVDEAKIQHQYWAMDDVPEKIILPPN
ncbi:calcineurin-like phosphoesterase domain-containing protein 1 [Rhodopirellula maiorica SM1]|uniref:Calcineurin-like phosphoesterase domain-containing protein 1 n=1 Tax=Rhodopirellula maiorica SM1 TaxID=1265738 RepID=M5RGC4_9BACT|nr:calcineurin-like phosphoesterase domain-containing protein 1 [Rhodopirellula maiorica SM1]